MGKEKNKQPFISKIIKVGRRGEIIIPKEIRELIDIKKGDEIFIMGIKSKESGFFRSGRIIITKTDEIVDIMDKILGPLMKRVRKR